MGSENEILEILKEIQAGAREGRQWRERAQETSERLKEKIEETKQNLAVLSGQLNELEKVMDVRLQNGIARFDNLDKRVLSVEEAVRSGGGGDRVDVTISSGNQTVGAEPAATATKSALPKTAAAAGGSGVLTWLFAGDGWQTITSALKKWLG
jgi:predicted RNase H-like nuclease (RuvC/YqgF family)